MYVCVCVCVRVCVLYVMCNVIYMFVTYVQKIIYLLFWPSLRYSGLYVLLKMFLVMLKQGCKNFFSQRGGGSKPTIWG